MSTLPADDASARLHGVLRSLAPAPPDEIRAGDRLIDDLGFDSISLAKTVVALEDAFGVELPQERLHELRSARVEDVARLLGTAGDGP